VSSKPLKSAQLERSDGRVTELQKSGDKGVEWTCGTFPIDKSGSYHITLTDNDGLKNSQPPIEYPIDAKPDRLPVVKLIKPNKDATVVPEARPVIQFDARDDFNVRAVSLVYRVGQEKEGITTSAGEIKRLPLNEIPQQKEIKDARFTWQLELLSLKPGDQVTFWLEAEDDCPYDRQVARVHHSGEDPEAEAKALPTKAVGRSAEMKFSVLSRSDKAAELQAEVERLYKLV